MREKLVFH
jgi:hypothetical protein